MSAVPENDLARAVALLCAGELVAFPTETVYGLGADAANPQAVARIFAAKGRPADHPLIVHLPDAELLPRWASDIPGLAWDLAEAFWPGPLTLILKKRPEVPEAVTGGQASVGLRVPAHPLARELLQAFAEAGAAAVRTGRGPAIFGGVAAPSANRFGRLSPTTAAHVRAELGAAVGLVLDGGPCAVGIESTIVDLSRDQPEILRPGHIAPADLARVLGAPPATRQSAGAPRVSGALASHYAPETPLRLVAPAHLRDFLGAQRHAGLVCGVLAHSQPAEAGLPHRWLMLPAEPEGYARQLYAALRALDAAGLDLIVIETPPPGPAWQAIHDRLRRAAA
jgi:L-threonylcarbamoyladenylate synthase